MTSEILRDKNIGIVGCGHLGQSLALASLHNGLPKERLFLSYGGSQSTAEQLAKKGLLACAVPNGRLFCEADLIIITLKPQDFPALINAGLRSDAVIVSSMAGVPLKLLREEFGQRVQRMMISGPDTILSGNGVAALYPTSEEAAGFLQMLGVSRLDLKSERELDVFTVGVCIPAALLQLDDSSGAGAAIERLSNDYPMMAQLYAWSLGALPELPSKDDRLRYIQRMMTKGGITEAVINSLRADAPLDAALKAGIARAAEISAQIASGLGK